MVDRSLTYRLKAEIGGFLGPMRQASASLGAFANQATRADKDGAKFRRGLTAAGDAAGKIGLVAGAGLGAAVVAAANFDQAMSRVQAATGESAGNMDKLREAALKAGAETVFSASESAAAIENLAKAGVSTKDILAGGLNGALDLAAAGTMEVADAAETAAVAMSQFGLSGEDVPHIADLLAAAAGKAQGEVSDMAYALKQGGLVANQVGLSIEETTGALAAFAQAGLIGSDAGTSLKTMLQSLTPTSAKAAVLMEELGISAYDQKGQFIGLEEWAGRLRDGLKGMSDEQRNATLKTVFGSDATRAATVIYEQGAKGIDKWITAVNDQGYAAEQAATKLDNLKGDLEALKGSLETALIGTGSGAQGPLRSIVQSLTDVVNAYNKLPQSAQSGVAGVLFATAGLGGVTFLAAKTVTGLASVRAAMADLGIQAGATRGALRAFGAGLGALAGVEALAQLDSFIDKMRDADLEVQGLSRSLSALGRGEVSGTLEDTFGGNLDGFADSIDRLNSKSQKLADFSASVLGIGKVIDTPMEEARANVDKLDEALAGLVEGGDPEQAAAVFSQLTAAAERQGIAVEDVSKHFEQYRVALANLNGGTNVASMFGEALGPIGEALARVTNRQEESTEAIKDNSAALAKNLERMEARRAAQLEALNAQIGYEAAIDDATEALRKNGKTVDITTEKGRANRTALYGMAAAWNELSTKAQNAPGAYRSAIRTFVDLAVKMGMGEDKARALAKRILEIKPREVKVDVDDADARRKLSYLERWRINDKSFKVTAVYGTAGSRYDQHARGSGGTGGRYATGGPVWGAGTATSDSIPAMLSNGEFVVKAAAVQKYGMRFLHQLNGMHLAAGGPVSTHHHYAQGGPVGFSDGDIARLAKAMMHARPLYGDVTVHGDGSFERSVRQRGVSLGGGD